MITDGNYIFVGLIALAGLLTIIVLLSRSILFSIAAGVSWLVLGVLLLTNQLVRSTSEIAEAVTVGGTTTTTTVVSTLPIFDSNLTQLLGYLFIAMMFASLLYYLMGLGKQKVTVTDGKRTWSMWERPPKRKLERSRASLARESHRDRLRVIRERRRL